MKDSIVLMRHYHPMTHTALRSPLFTDSIHFYPVDSLVVWEARNLNFRSDLLRQPATQTAAVDSLASIYLSQGLRVAWVEVGWEVLAKTDSRKERGELAHAETWNESFLINRTLKLKKVAGKQQDAVALKSWLEQFRFLPPFGRWILPTPLFRIEGQNVILVPY